MILTFHCNISIRWWSVHMYYCFNCVSNQVSTPVSLYTSDMSLNKYGCHITNMSHTAIMVNGYLDPIPCTDVQKHYHLKYLLHMLLPHICQQEICLHMCKLVHMQMRQPCHASYELTTIRSIGIHNFTLLAYAPKLICLQHCIQMSQ